MKPRPIFQHIESAFGKALRRRSLRALTGGFQLIALLVLMSALAPAQKKTQHVVLIISDGLRWQEIFTGADPTLMNSESGGSWASTDTLRKDFWRDDVAERRKILFPFLWGVIAQQGQIFGNQAKGSVAHVTNSHAISYPGYSEMLTGYPDPKIDRNEFGPNPNRTVFEWLNEMPEFQGKVAVYATWGVIANVFNQKRSQLVMQVGWDLPEKGELTPRQQLINELYRTTTQLDQEDTYNAFLQVPLLEYVQAHRPAALFVGYGETDNWAHSGRYDLVLQSARQFDRFVEQLWTTMQALPEYRGTTTFIVTTDHGRGSGLTEWKEHGTDQKGSENIWLAVMGPGTPPLGERQNTAPVTQAQVAATVAQLLGKDYRQAVSAAAPPLDLTGGK